jgi:hypothetical protein
MTPPENADAPRGLSVAPGSGDFLHEAHRILQTLNKRGLALPLSADSSLMIAAAKDASDLIITLAVELEATRRVVDEVRQELVNGLVDGMARRWWDENVRLRELMRRALQYGLNGTACYDAHEANRVGEEMRKAVCGPNDEAQTPRL